VLEIIGESAPEPRSLLILRARKDEKIFKGANNPIKQ
jgi:hypothetical protein